MSKYSLVKSVEQVSVNINKHKVFIYEIKFVLKAICITKKRFILRGHSKTPFSISASSKTAKSSFWSVPRIMISAILFFLGLATCVSKILIS